MSIPPGLNQVALDIIKSSLRLCRVLDPNEEPSGTDANQALEVLNQFLDGLDADALGIFTQDITDFTFSVGKQSYTLGEEYTDDNSVTQTPDWSMSRPAVIERMSVILNATNIELPLRYTLSEMEWQQILIKTIQTTYPWICYDKGDFPFRTLMFYPKPGEADTCRIYSWQALTKAIDLTTTLRYPPAYAEMIRYNLALRLNGEFNGEMSADDKRLAMAMLSKVQSANLKVDALKCEDSWGYGTAISYTGSDIPPIY